MTRHCEHVKANGHFCGSPAMRNRNYCFFHLNHLGSKLRAEKQAARGHVAFELPLLEDSASIQLALMQVANAMLHGTLDAKRGGLVLYALQTASINLRNLEKDAKSAPPVAVCDRYDSFEADYELDESDGLRVETVDDEPEEVYHDAPGTAYGDPTEMQELIDTGLANGYFNLAYMGTSEDEGQDTAPVTPCAVPEGSSPMAPQLDPFAESGAMAGSSDAQEATAGDGNETSASAGRAGAHAGAQAANVRTANRRAPHVVIPEELSRSQYHQAKCAVTQYELRHKLTRREIQSVPERPALSQKMFVGGRKPPASVEVETSNNAQSA